MTFGVMVSSIRWNIPLGPVPTPAALARMPRGGQPDNSHRSIGAHGEIVSAGSDVPINSNLPTITPDEPVLAEQQTNDLDIGDFRPYSAPDW